MLLNQYLDMRQEVAKLDLKGDSFLPVGIRQLEALIRLSEALAKMKLQSHEGSTSRTGGGVKVFALVTFFCFSFR